MNKNIVKNIIMYVSIAFFIVITMINLFHHVPWFDEFHAWDYSQKMNIHNVYSIIKTEGHFIIWYLILMPFAKFNLYYPYSMSLINWIIFFIAILIMWKKAPFNTFAKIIITFSWISLNYYSIVARCYSIGILGLFIISVLYKEQLKKSILYASVLVLTAHTSLVATMAVIPLSMIFVFDLIKSRKNFPKKNIIISLGILFVGAILWVAPFVTGYGRYTQYSSIENVWEYYIDFFKINNWSLLILYLTILIILFIKADKRIKFFILMTTAQFYIFHSIFYPALPHNVIFVFIYIIIAYWLTPKIHNIKQCPFVSITYLVCFAILLSFNHGQYMKYALNNPDKSDLIQYLNNRPNKEYIYMNWYFTEILPYLSTDYIYRDKLVNLDDCYTDSCIHNVIKEDLKQYTDSWNAVVITPGPLNENSIEFEYVFEYNGPKYWFVTTYNDK